MRTGPSYRRHSSLIAEPGPGAILASIALLVLLITVNMLGASGGGLH